MTPDGVMPNGMTEAQDKAFAFLNDRYGDCVIAERSPVKRGPVKLEGVDEDGEVRARWWVEHDGRVAMAWDPDYTLDAYDKGRKP